MHNAELRDVSRLSLRIALLPDCTPVHDVTIGLRARPARRPDLIIL